MLDQFLMWGVIAFIIGLIILVVIILIQTEVIQNLDEDGMNSFDITAWYWWLIDIIALILIIVGIALMCKNTSSKGYNLTGGLEKTPEEISDFTRS